MDGDSFIDPIPDNSVEAARFLRFLDLSPILAVLEGFYCEPWRHRHLQEDEPQHLRRKQRFILPGGRWIVLRN